MQTRNLKIILGLVALFMLILAGCQAQAPAATEQPPAATEPEGAYPGPGSPQPTAELDVSGNPQPSYPAPGEFIDWDRAVEMITGGSVAQIFQLHTQTIILVTSDGTVYSSAEPNLDDVKNVLEQCGEPCANIEFVTE